MQELKKLHKMEEIENNQQWGEDYAIAKLLHIGVTVQHSTSQDLPTYKLENDRRYHVDMPQSPTMRKQ